MTRQLLLTQLCGTRTGEIDMTTLSYKTNKSKIRKERTLVDEKVNTFSIDWQGLT